MQLQLMKSGSKLLSGRCGVAAPHPTAKRVLQSNTVLQAKRSDKPGKDDKIPVIDESDFDRETARLVLRMLTARAAGAVLQNISEVDTYKSQWLQDHFRQNPPLEGNTFLANLLNAKPVHGVDPYTGATYHVNPAHIASAVIATREALALKLAKNLEAKVADANMDVMRTHLENHTYVSGSNNERRPSFRHYRRQHKQRQHW